jgi:glutamyl-tRNA synthetase
LLAKSTGGQFLLRLEDTDQKRLVEGAEENIYRSLKWCGIEVDEGPQQGGPYGPYRQSDRTSIYQQYAEKLIQLGHAYRCSCSQQRLLSLRESAAALKPPTTVTYDRKCLHNPLENGDIIRFKSPPVYEPFDDILHGHLNLQPQYNSNDRRYDDFVILKSDGLPTYHFANVVDDHLMRITHVIRGEEWLPSTPKHIALYRAFGWDPPQFTHIPLLTSMADKKLSKRSGDIGVFSYKERGILPAALVNFVALLGWSPPRDTPGVSVDETMDLSQLVEKFSLDHLTKGNVKVNESKLYFFNKQHLQQRISSDCDLVATEYFSVFDAATGHNFDITYLKKILVVLGPSLQSLDEITSNHAYLFTDDGIDFTKGTPTSKKIVLRFLELWALPFAESTTQICEELNVKKKDVFQSLRTALAGGAPGLTIPLLVDVLGDDTAVKRLKKFVNA